MVTLESNAEKWTGYEVSRREALLQSVPEDERESLAKLDFDTLEYVTNKINQTKPNAPEVAGLSKEVISNKTWGEMTDAERRKSYEIQARVR